MNATQERSPKEFELLPIPYVTKGTCFFEVFIGYFVWRHWTKSDTIEMLTINTQKNVFCFVHWKIGELEGKSASSIHFPTFPQFCEIGM